MPHDEITHHEENAPPHEGDERRVSLSITVRPSTRSRLEIAAKQENNTISRIAEMAMIAYLDEKGI
jgi:hypothetical protein